MKSIYKVAYVLLESGAGRSCCAVYLLHTLQDSPVAHHQMPEAQAGWVVAVQLGGCELVSWASGEV